MPERQSAASVEALGVTKRFGEGPGAVTALDDVTVRIEGGEFFTLLGPSGCGKTTLLRMIAGFEPTSAGEIRLAGEPVQALPPYRRPVNTVFQSYALFPHLTVERNVAFGLEMRRVPRAEARWRWGWRWRWCGSPAWSAATRASSPAASSSAWRWPARSRTGHGCCCSTSRSRPWT
jgi:ABC-type proline/glycine betaine transport system ATPase subunit